MIPGIDQIIIYVVAIIICSHVPRGPDGPQRRDGGLNSCSDSKNAMTTPPDRRGHSGTLCGADLFSTRFRSETQRWRSSTPAILT